MKLLKPPHPPCISEEHSSQSATCLETPAGRDQLFVRFVKPELLKKKKQIQDRDVLIGCSATLCATATECATPVPLAPHTIYARTCTHKQGGRSSSFIKFCLLIFLSFCSLRNQCLLFFFISIITKSYGCVKIRGECK